MRAGRLLALCVVTFGLSAQLSLPQPVPKTLEDFEGQLVGWPEGIALSYDASQGQKAVRWQPTEGDGPKFHYFDFSSRGVELIEWDRLLFDYKVEGPGCEWWGIKVTDYPLGDGMQATWLVGDSSSLMPGKWQTAEVDLRHPQWLWGNEPNNTIQQIAFRCQFRAGVPSAILIDNVRLDRDPVHIDAIEKGETLPDGDSVRVEYAVTVANALEQPVSLRADVRDASEGLQTSLSSTNLSIPGRQTGTVSVQLSARVRGPEALPPLSRLSAQCVLQVKGMDDSEKTVDLSLAVPLGDLPHPSLLVTRETVARVLSQIEGSPEARSIYEGLKRGADAWLERTPEFPDRGSQWWHWYTCKECGARLQTRSATEHLCPDCGEVYSGWPYDDVVLDRQHNALAQAIRDLGLMYQFTGDDAYAEKAREILLGYAERYLNYPLHNTRGEPKTGGGHVGPQTLDESTWLIPVAQGFDCVYEALSEADVEVIAEKLLLPAAQLIHDHQWGIHNICCWHASAYGLVGLTLGNEELAADAISGPKGFRAQIEQGVTDDGFWYESAWGYHFYTMSALQPLAVAARNVGIDLYTDRYKSMYDAPLTFMGPGGALAAFNDSGTANPLGQGRLYEVAYARWGDPRFLLPIHHTGRGSLETLLHGVPDDNVPPFRLESTVLPDAGYVILRSGQTGDSGAEQHIPENYVALDYGPHGGGHGHPDKLGFVLYGKGALLAEDPGSIAYGNPAHGGWFRQTISHNTIAVNGKSQKGCTGTLQFAAFAGNMSLCSARADEAYDGVRLRRSMALLGDRVIDIVLCEAEEDCTFDLGYHNRGAFETLVPLSPMEAPPEGDGYDWAKQWRAAEVPGPWSAVWRQEGGPTVTFAQAAVDGKAQVLTAVGMGNPTSVKVPFVVSRRMGTRALYCTALEITDAEPVEDLAVRLLTVERPAETDETPVAVEVTGSGVRDVVLINPAGGTLRAEAYQLEGQGAVLQYAGEELRQILVVGDAKVRVVGP